MNYRRLGGSGLWVSEICLGNWLTHGKQVDALDSRKIVREAFKRGVNFFDTADIYAEGVAEEVLGFAIRGIPRQEIVIATKCHGLVRGKGLTARGNSRKHIIEAIEASLRRLKLDYVDLYQLHRNDPDTPLEETLGALNDLVRQGKTIYVGCSNFDSELMRRAHALCRRYRWEWFVSNQPLYNLMEREVEKGLMQICSQQGVGLIPYSPQAQGFLTGKYRSLKDVRKGTRFAEQPRLLKRYCSARNFARVGKLCVMAQEIGCTPSQLALRWLLRKDVVSAAIVGARKVSQIRESIGASDVKVSLSQLEKLSRLFSIDRDS